MKSPSKPLSKHEHAVRETLAGSGMVIRPRAQDQHGISHLTIEVHGPAARIPSTSNSRLNVRRGATIVSTINPEHKVRLDALTRLYESVAIKPARLNCNKNVRWFCLLLIHEQLYRCDSHNLVKPLADWLQKIGIIENDKFIDCLVLRNIDYNVPKPEKLTICLRRSEQIDESIQHLIDDLI